MIDVIIFHLGIWFDRVVDDVCSGYHFRAHTFRYYLERTLFRFFSMRTLSQ